MDQCGRAGVCSCSTACAATRNSTWYTRDVAAHCSQETQKQLRSQPGLQEQGVKQISLAQKRGQLSFCRQGFHFCVDRGHQICSGIKFQSSLTAGPAPSGCCAMSLSVCLLLVPLLEKTNTTSRHPLDRRVAVVLPTMSSLCILSKEGLKLTPAPFTLHLSHVPAAHTCGLPSQSGLCGDRFLMDP